MNRAVLVTIGVLAFVAGGILLAMSGSPAMTTAGTVSAIAGLGLLAWAWRAPSR